MKGLVQYINEDVNDELTPIDELPDGIYKARYYAWTFELEDGRKYKPKCGVLRSRQLTPVEEYKLEDGYLFRVDELKKDIK